MDYNKLSSDKLLDLMSARGLNNNDIRKILISRLQTNDLTQIKDVSTKSNFRNTISLDFEIRLVDIQGRVSNKIISGNSEFDDFEKFREIVSRISNIPIGNLVMISERQEDNEKYGLEDFPKNKLNNIINILVINNTISQFYKNPVNIKLDNTLNNKNVGLDIVISIEIDSSWTVSRLENEILSRGLTDFASIVYNISNSESNIHTDFVLPEQLYIGAIPSQLFNFKILTNSNI